MCRVDHWDLWFDVRHGHRFLQGVHAHRWEQQEQDGVVESRQLPLSASAAPSGWTPTKEPTFKRLADCTGTARMEVGPPGTSKWWTCIQNNFWERKMFYAKILPKLSFLSESYMYSTRLYYKFFLVFLYLTSRYSSKDFVRRSLFHLMPKSHPQHIFYQRLKIISLLSYSDLIHYTYSITHFFLATRSNSASRNLNPWKFY